ncbi:hypothetical protein N9V07_03630 [Candidatus Pelagibacter sp.]|jgi:hypothetical protein|nr:hypothetical protein [Candidatus Pelagibacter sp.]HCI70365.1 hypothetical protein [Balneola sp.]|tara:strand:+ start:1375 stop:1563 length:189 start_codon:yes stop_codon:yes gene_type:complete
MRAKNINKIYNMVCTQRQGFDENYPTARKLAEDIHKVFSEDMLATIEKKEAEWQKKQETKIQ